MSAAHLPASQSPVATNLSGGAVEFTQHLRELQKQIEVAMDAALSATPDVTRFVPPSLFESLRYSALGEESG